MFEKDIKKKKNSMTLEADSNILLTTFHLESSLPCQRWPGVRVLFHSWYGCSFSPSTGQTAFSIHLSGPKPPSVPESGGPGRRWSWLWAGLRERGPPRARLVEAQDWAFGKSIRKILLP